MYGLFVFLENQLLHFVARDAELQGVEFLHGGVEAAKKDHPAQAAGDQYGAPSEFFCR
jgi:hypothetical protein|tara:strand:- start:228 stop:401 length:174 start_codon:yes stop_codon:yes gene_type:complete